MKDNCEVVNGKVKGDAAFLKINFFTSIFESNHCCHGILLKNTYCSQQLVLPIYSNRGF